MGLAVVFSRCVHGSEALSIRVETHLSNGLPSCSLVGLPETAVRESRERVRSAIINSGFEFPQRRITINLAPGDVPKDGTRFDLAIAVSILAASNQVPAGMLEHNEFVAELALDGSLRTVRAGIATAVACTRAGRDLIVSSSSAGNACLVPDARIRAAGNLRDVAAHLGEVETLPLCLPGPPVGASPSLPDLADVYGQQQARRALELAASGGHNLLMIGPPGTGKSMLAARLSGILPPLNDDDALAVASLHSIAGLERDPQAWACRPFRSPHHSASPAAITGGGREPAPGEMSLAHLGVLFFDELPEFDRRALEALREPLEQRSVSISRASGRYVFPANFQFVAAMNPCPCGYLGDPAIDCQCTNQAIDRYRSRLSGPLVERIDLQVQVPRQTRDLLANTTGAESSDAVQRRVVHIRTLQLERQGVLNAALEGAALKLHCEMDADARELLARSIEHFALSARGHHKILRVARTLADIDGHPRLSQAHLAEAIGYRLFDRGAQTATRP